jgi:hypothetical protein
MEQMPKKAAWVLLEDQVVVECPYCGRTLLTAKYGRMEKLLNYQGPVPAKICKNCSKVVLLKVSSQLRTQIQAKIDGLAVPSKHGSRLG